MVKKRKAVSRLLGPVDVECPWCGKNHQCALEETEEIERDDFGDFLGSPPADRFTCACGADLLVIGEPEDFDVIWCNKEKMLLCAWLELKPKVMPIIGNYYDLIRVPHGHIPVSKVFLWKRFPLLVREIRGNDYFKCPSCGGPSFFKVNYQCPICDDEYGWLRPKFRRRERRDYFRKFLKDLEVLVLPVLALMGKAWYVRSGRHHWKDGYVGYGRRHYE